MENQKIEIELLQPEPEIEATQPEPIAAETLLETGRELGNLEARVQSLELSLLALQNSSESEVRLLSNRLAALELLVLAEAEAEAEAEQVEVEEIVPPEPEPQESEPDPIPQAEAPKWAKIFLGA